MAIELAPLHPTLGAELRGVDLTRPVGPQVFAEIDAAFNRHGILVFPEQPVTDEQQLAFSRLFGPLEVNPNYAGAKMRLRADVADISNLDPRGRVLARDDRRNLFNLGNQLWHTDSSFKRVPAKCSLLSAREIPSAGPMGGGETEFADLRADSTEHLAGTRLKELSVCQSWLPMLNRLRRSSRANTRPSASRFEMSAMSGRSRIFAPA